MSINTGLIKLTQIDSGLPCFIRATDIVAIVELEEIINRVDCPKRTRIDTKDYAGIVLVKETANYINVQIATITAIAEQKEGVK